MENPDNPHSQPSHEIILPSQPLASVPAARPQYIDLRSSEPAEEPESGGLLDYWLIVRRRKYTLLGTALAGALLAFLYTLPQTPVYQARTTLEVQGVNENFMNMGNVNPTTTTNTNYPELDIQTQIRILQSESLNKRVLAKLKTQEGSSFVPKTTWASAWRKVLRLPEAPLAAQTQAAMAMASGNLRVRVAGQTRIIEVLCDSTDPEIAARFLNTLAAEYTEQNLEARWQTTEKTGEFLARQLDDVRIKLEKSEQRLQSYAAGAGLLFTGNQSNVAEDKLKQAQQELSAAQADRMAKQSRYEMASKSPPEALPDVLDDESLGAYRSNLADLRRQLSELNSTLTAAHPKVKKVQAQITSVEAALEKQRGAIVKKIQNEYETALRRENLLAKNYAAQSSLVTNQTARATEYNILKREVDTNRQLYDMMLQKVKEAGVVSALRANSIRVVDAATTPSRPYKPDFYRNSMLGLMGGLFLGLLFVLVTEHADRTIQGPGDAAYYLNVPELGIIPSAEAARGRGYSYYEYYKEDRSGGRPKAISMRNEKVELVAWRQKPSLLGESYRATLASIMFAGENGSRPRVIVLTSPNPKEGKTTTTSNLALSMAEIHRRVLLIDADMRKPKQHEIFHVPNEWGLSDLLQGKALPAGRDRPEIQTSYNQLHVLPAGSPAESIASLLHSSRVEELLERWREEYDTVLIDTPPMLHIPDARVLGKLADAVILVVRSNETTRDMAQAAAQRFREDGTRLLGTILNYWNPKKAKGYYGYGYGLKHYYHMHYYHKNNNDGVG